MNRSPMDPAERLLALERGSQRERLDAARALARTATEQELPALRKALRSEQLPWIRSAIEAAIARASAGRAPDGKVNLAPLTGEDALATEVYARAIEELTDRLVHELRPLLGL